MRPPILVRQHLSILSHPPDILTNLTWPCQVGVLHLGEWYLVLTPELLHIAHTVAMGVQHPPNKLISSQSKTCKKKNKKKWTVMYKLMTRSNYNFAHARTAQLSLYAQNCNLMDNKNKKQRQKYLRSQALPGRCVVPGTDLNYHILHILLWCQYVDLSISNWSLLSDNLWRSAINIFVVYHMAYCT